MLEKDKQITSEMMEFFKVDKVEDLAVALGYSPKTANTWHTKGLTKSVINKYELIKQAKMNETSKKLVKTNEIQRTFNISSTQIQIPIFANQYASAGHGIDNHDEECEVFVFNKFELKAMFNLSSLKNLRLIKVSGNSMYPTINEGEMVLFQSDGSEHEGSIYIVRYYDEVFIKRLFKRPKLMLKSDNKDYEPIVINEDEEIEILGRVVGSINIGYKRF